MMLSTINPVKFSQFMDFRTVFCNLLMNIRNNYSKLGALIYLNECKLKGFLYLYKANYKQSYGRLLNDFIIYIFSVYYYNNDFNGLASFMYELKNDLNYYKDLISFYGNHFDIVFEKAMHKEKRIIL